MQSSFNLYYFNMGGGHVLGSIPKPAVPSSVLVELLHLVAVTLQAQGKPNQTF